MKRMLFVYNPRSGKGLIRNHLSAIIELFSANEFAVTVYPTKRERDAYRIVSEQASEFDLVVCSGGDGTLDEVVSGMMENTDRCPIGYIPAGSTNDFGNSLGIPKQMEEAAEIIVHGTPFHCDIGRFNHDYFVYVAAFGFMTDVSYTTDQEMKNMLGHTAYILEGIKHVTDWKNYHLRIESEEFTDEGDFIYGMITNSTSVGGFKGIIGRDIELNDGLFEVMLVRTPQTIANWPEAITAILMQDIPSRSVVRFKTSHLTITSDEPVAWTRDGEDGGKHTSVELTDLKQAVAIMAESEEPVLVAVN